MEAEAPGKADKAKASVNNTALTEYGMRGVARGACEFRKARFLRERKRNEIHDDLSMIASSPSRRR